MKIKIMQLVDQICNTKSTNCRNLNKRDLARELLNLAAIPQNADIQEIPLDWNRQVVILFLIPGDKENYYSLFAGIGNDGKFYFKLSITGKYPCSDKFYFLDKDEILPIDHFLVGTNEYNRLVSYIYTRSQDELMILARIIKAAGKDVIDPIKSAFERVLNIPLNKINVDKFYDVYRFYYDEA